MMYAIGLPQMAWHTKFREDRFRNSGNINDATTAIWEALVLALLMGGFMMNAIQMTSGGMIYIPTY
jgi:hypothetical protein